MLEKRRLASSVGAHETVDLARGGAESHTLEGGLTAERSREVINVDDKLSHAYLLTFAGSLLVPDSIAARRSSTIRKMSSAVKFNWCASANRASIRCSMMRCRSRFASRGRSSDTNVPEPWRL